MVRLWHWLRLPVERVLSWPLVETALRTRALRAWRATDEPLIVCLGNVNRSPFAARLARRRAGSRARSAGFYPEAGRHSPALTVTAAAASGIDLSDHCSQMIDDEMLRHAPAIFVFDLDNLARMALRAPLALRRTHLLGALRPDGQLVIRDPHGQGPAALDAALTQITAAIDHADATRHRGEPS